MTGAEISAIAASWGLWALIPLAILEGPVISLVTGWMVSLGLVGLATGFTVIVIGDVLGDCVLYLIGGWLGRRAGADTSKSRPFMALMWLSVVTTLIGLLAARATTSGWEAWFSLLIAVILSLYATKVVKRSTRI